MTGADAALASETVPVAPADATPASGRVPVSVIVLTHDEEAQVEGCLASLAPFAGELFVVDSGSRDRTLEIARRYTDRIVHHPFENYAAQRNWAQANLPLSHEWVLHVDAGERATPELVSAIRRALEAPPPDVDGFVMPCRYHFLGRWLRWGGRYPVYHLRLLRRVRGRCEDRLYDQHFVAEGRVERLDGDLVDLMSADLERWTTRHARWARMEAAEHEAARDPGALRLRASLTGDPRERRRWLRERVFARAPLFVRGPAYFLFRYVFQLGFLDGRAGLIYHALQAGWLRFLIDAMIYERRIAAKGERRDG